MADLSKTVSIIFQGVNSLGGVLSGINGDLDKTQAELGATGEKAKQAGDLWQDAAGRWRNATGQFASDAEKAAAGVESISKSGSGLDAVVNSMKALAAAVVIKEFIDANVEAERFEKAMTQIKGSTELAAQEFEYIKDVSNVLGLEVGKAADAYVSLSAATRGSALEGQATRDIYEAVSKAMSTLGRSSEDTEGALLAISQIVSKGNVSMEELRGQLGERLPGAFGIAAKAMGLTTQELDALVASGNLTATEFLPKFAQALRDTYGETTYVDGFIAAQNRLTNQIKESYQILGETGAFDAFTKGIQLATATVTGAVTAFEVLGKSAGLLAAFLSGNVSFEFWKEEQNQILLEGAENTRAARDALFGADQAAKDLKYSAEQAGKAVASGAQTGEASAKELEAQTKALNASLKTLGIDPKKFTEPTEEIVKAFEAIASNPAVRGDQFLTGLLVTLDKISGQEAIAKVGTSIEAAFKRGALTADEYKVALDALGQKQSGVFDALPEYSKKADDNAAAIKRQKDETDKAKEAAEKYALELEKIASNERIKFIEAKISFDIAQLEEDTKRIEATFASIDNTVNSTGELIGDLFGILKDYDNLSFGAIRLIEQQLESENKARQEAFALQKALTEATIEEMRARTQSLINGDPLITINGDGLQPHLEAFMWEILKTIQTRVNADGLKLLLGV